MKLIQLEMFNFRQFYDYHSIEFATGNKNITIFKGKNNAGKTGIYRALLYGLYGDRLLAQDTDNKKIHLINEKALKENSVTEMYVKVTIEHNENIYIIKRETQGVIDKNRVVENKIDNLNIKKINEFGEYESIVYESEEDIQNFIDNILDSSIKEFFLFDGEKIETLARTDRNAREEVKKGITKLMQIDKLEEVKKAVSKLYEIEKNIIVEKNKNNRAYEINKNIKNNKSEINKKNEIIDVHEKELEYIEKGILEYKANLEKNEEIAKKIEIKRKLETEKSHLLSNVEKDTKNLVKYKFNKLHSLVMEDSYKIIKERLSRNMSERRDVIPIFILEQSLKNNLCMCCNQSLSEKNLSLNYVKELYNQYKYSDVTELMNKMLLEIDSSFRIKDDIKAETKELLLEIHKNNELINEADHKIENLNFNISNEKNIEKDYEFSKEEYNKLLGKKEVKIESIKQYKEEIYRIKSITEKLDLDLQKAIKDEEDNRYQTKRLLILKDFIEKINDIYEKHLFKTKQTLSSETTKIFKELIDYENLTWIEKIEINDRFEIDILNRDGRDITQDISQGQQQIVALSFITALAKIASKNEGYVDFPLFMDTAFGKLSKENRKNLIIYLPDLTQQWIPLFTDTEYTDYERKIMEKSNRIGKSYIIRKISNVESEIIEEEVS